MSLLAQLPADMPVNITCGNSGPKPGVVYAHAVNGALAQSGRLAHLNVGTWPDTGVEPAADRRHHEGPGRLVLRGDDLRRAQGPPRGGFRPRFDGHGNGPGPRDSHPPHLRPGDHPAGHEAAGRHAAKKGAYDQQELAAPARLGRSARRQAAGSQPAAGGEAKFNQSLALYLIVRDLLAELNAVGGGFMNQLEWGSDRRGIPLPDRRRDGKPAQLHASTTTGPSRPMPFATEADVQGLLTMLFTTWLSGGNPPLFMDFRKVWEPWEIQGLAKKLGVPFTGEELWARRGSSTATTAARPASTGPAGPATPVEKIMANVSMPRRRAVYFPGGGNSVTFITPGGIDCIASRLAYSDLSGMFSLVWDEATTVDLPEKLATAVAHTSNVTWPHTWIVPKYATMAEYKQYAPANHFHAIWGLAPRRLQYWMDMANVLSVAPWARAAAVDRRLDRPAAAALSAQRRRDRGQAAAGERPLRFGSREWHDYEVSRTS